MDQKNIYLYNPAFDKMLSPKRDLCLFLILSYALAF